MRQTPIYVLAAALPMLALVSLALFLWGIPTVLAQNGDGPRLSVTPSRVLANQRVNLIGTGFAAGSVIGRAAKPADQVSLISVGGETISWSHINDGNAIAVDSEGSWSAAVNLPLTEATTAEGDRTVSVTDSEGSTGSFTVTIPRRSVNITPDTGRVGTIALVGGDNFPARNSRGSSFNVEVVYHSGNDYVTTVATLPDASGSFQVQLRIPTVAAIPSTNSVQVSFEDDNLVSTVNSLVHSVTEGIITLSQASGAPGSRVTIDAEGFRSFVNVQKVTIGAIEVTPVTVPALTTDTHGMASFDIIIPGLDPGVHTIEVQIGSHTASAPFTVTEQGTQTPDPTLEDCGASLSGDRSTSGEWAAGCQSAVSGRGFAKYYSFSLDQQSDVTIDLESSVDTYLYVRAGEAKSGTILHENDDVEIGNTNSRISETLGAGSYTIEATTFKPNVAGSFTLTVTGLDGGGTTGPDLADPCDEAISGDGPVDGQWAGGCHSQAQGRGFARYYTFTLDQDRQVTIDLESSVDTYLYLREGEARSGTALHENDDIESGNTNSRISETLAAGTYTIEATTYSPGQTGSFTLTVTGLDGGGTTAPDPADPCLESISEDGTKDGDWASDCQSQAQGRGYAKYYTFTLDQDREVTIDLESSVDTYLYLREGGAKSGPVLHENDDIESGNTNSRISETLAAGTYTIEATTYSPGQTGGFTLTISGLGTSGVVDPDPSPADPCVVSITGDGSRDGEWSAGCQSQARGRGYARYYTFTLEQDREVAIDLESSVDTYLYLREGEAKGGEALHENDDIESGNTNSRITQRLAAGTHTVEATTYSPAQTGRFTLTLTGLDSGGTTEPDPAETCGEVITGAGSRDGVWAAECQSQTPGRGYARYYSFTLEQDREVTIDLESTVDTYLYLREGGARSGTTLHENDDIENGNTNSRISQTLAAGSYTIEATTYNPAETGTFNITVTIGGLQPDEPPQVLLGTASLNGRLVPPGTSITAWDADEEIGAAIARLGGRYTLLIFRSTGPITFKIGGRDADQTFTDWTSGSRTRGFDLTATDPCLQFLDGDGPISEQWSAVCQSKIDGRGHARYFSFTLAGERDIALTLVSPDADTYLYLRAGYSSSGMTLYQNDVAGDGSTNSVIRVTLSAGVYTLEATTYNPGETGSFTLTISGLGE